MQVVIHSKIKDENIPMGFLSPEGKFYPVIWGKHEKFAGEYVLEHNPEENIEIEIMQLIQKNNINGVSAKSILEKIKTQKNSSNEMK